MSCVRTSTVPLISLRLTHGSPLTAPFVVPSELFAAFCSDSGDLEPAPADEGVALEVAVLSFCEVMTLHYLVT